jgi:hypothetical protein
VTWSRESPLQALREYHSRRSARPHASASPIRVGSNSLKTHGRGGIHVTS